MVAPFFLEGSRVPEAVLTVAQKRCIRHGIRGKQLFNLIIFYYKWFLADEFLTVFE